jgi:hypothetical protein
VLSSSPSASLLLFSPLLLLIFIVRISKGQASVVVLSSAVILENGHQRAYLILTAMSCLESSCNARFEVLMAVTMMITIFWDVTVTNILEEHNISIFRVEEWTFTLLSWRCRCQVPLKHWHWFTRLHIVTSQKTMIFIS